jgi:hypothetical protein
VTAIESAPSLRAVRPLATTRHDLDGVLQALDGLVASTDPAVVFESLRRVCVPVVCDDATLRMAPVAEPASRLTTDSVQTLVDVGPFDGIGGYRAVLRLRHHDRHPGIADVLLARLAVDRALTLIDRERSAATVARARVEVDALGRALDSSREIGVAMGIVMARHSLTGEQGFALLRRVSQRRNQKLRDVALDVVRTGQLELACGVTLTDTDGRVATGPRGPATRR